MTAALQMKANLSQLSFEEIQCMIEEQAKVFATHIQALIKEAKYDEVNKYTNEYQVLVAEMSAALTVALNNDKAKETHLSIAPINPYDQYSELDFSCIVFSREKELLQELWDDSYTRSLWQYYAGIVQLRSMNTSAKKALISSAVPAHPTYAPKLFDAYNECARILKLKLKARLYIYNDPIQNAFCYKPENEEFILAFSSSMINSLNQAELQAIIGHELAHAILGHLEIPSQALIASGKLPPATVIKIFNWSKAREISADRFSALCSPDMHINTLSAMLKATSGLTDFPAQINLHSFAEEYFNESLALLQNGQNFDQWYSTHPFSPIRLKSLISFSQSEMCKNFKDDAILAKTNESFDAEVNKFFSFFDAPVLNENHPQIANIRRFTYVASVGIISVDGIIDQNEIDSLTSLFGNSYTNEEMFAISQLPVESKQEMLLNLSQALVHNLSFNESLSIIRDLVYVSASDMAITYDELSVINWCAQLLNVPVHFIDVIINEITNFRR